MRTETQKVSWWVKAFNTSILEKKRMAWVDYLRGIAILLVVYRHVLIGLKRGAHEVPAGLETANMIFFSFRMPLFFILSGLFISASIAKRPLHKLIYNKFEGLIYPYLVWASIQITIQIILQYAMAGNTNANRGWMDYVMMFYQPRALDQFWYLPALFNATAIYLLTKVRLGFSSTTQLCLGAVLYVVGFYCRPVSMMSDWMEYYVFFALGDAIYTFFFKDTTQRFLKNKWVFVACIPVFIVTQLYYLSNYFDVDGSEYYLYNQRGRMEILPILFVGCFTMFVLALRLQKWEKLSFLRILGFHSLQIYVMHVIVSAFVRTMLIRLFGIEDPYVLLFSGMTAGVLVPVVLYNLLMKDNIGWFLFTPRRPRKKTPVIEGSPDGRLFEPQRRGDTKFHEG